MKPHSPKSIQNIIQHLLYFEIDIRIKKFKLKLIITIALSAILSASLIVVLFHYCSC